MKKYLLSKSIALFLIAATFSSCDSVLDQDNDKDFGKGPVLAQFVNSSVSANFIKDGEIQSYNIPLTIIGGKNEPLKKDVTITISIDPSSTAVSGTEFTLENTTYIIPAGSMTVDAKINVLTDNLDPFDAKTLVLKIDSSSTTISENNTTSVVLQAVCEFDINTFVGTYTSTSGGASTAATVTLGDMPNSLKITAGSEKFYIVLSDDPTSPTITYVPEGAVQSINASYGDVWATTITPESSTYNSCNNRMKLEFKRCVNVGCFAGTKVNVLVKQ